MIIALLVLIILALVFPGFVRAVFALVILAGLWATWMGHDAPKAQTIAQNENSTQTETGVLPSDKAKESTSLSKTWNEWPKENLKCSPDLQNRYFNDLINAEDAIEISECAHVSIYNLKKFLYVSSQTGSTKEEALQGIIGLANTISHHENEIRHCFLAANINPMDKKGTWRDMSELIVDISTKTTSEDLDCFRRIH